MRYDIAAIGNDESAIEMLCVAASAGQKTIAVLPESRHSSWMMAQALRRLVTGLLVDRTTLRRTLYARAGTPRLLQRLMSSALTAEVAEHVQMLEQIGVDVLIGEPRFQLPNELLVSTGIDCGRTIVAASNVVIGTGVRQTAMHRPLGLLPFHRPESLFEGLQLPKSLCILGGDDFGAGLASLFSLFGVESRLLARDDLTSSMLELAESVGVLVGYHPSELGLLQDTMFGSASSGASSTIDCRRTVGFTDHLNLGTIGVEPDENGRLWCAANFETWCTGVFGIGDVVGFTSNETQNPRRQAERILNRVTHRIRAPHFLRSRSRMARHSGTAFLSR